MKKRESNLQTMGLPSEYGQLLTDIKARVRSAQLAAFPTVNRRKTRTVGARSRMEGPR